MSLVRLQRDQESDAQSNLPSRNLCRCGLDLLACDFAGLGLPSSAGSGAARSWLQARGPMLPGKIGAADAEEEARRGAFPSWAARPGSEHQFTECISLSQSEFSVQRVVETNFSLLLRE